ncbi:MAG TPA: 2OG-Fe(II) oxygenase [Gemmataceae bacterium]|nr:2OG-Fe(II) oxygenase [Gemmataceae bacterium]
MRKELLNDLEDVFVIRGFLSPAECEQYIAQSEAAGYGDAPINVFGGQVVDKGMRNNDRVMIDDPKLAATLWERLQPFVPEARGSWRACGLNERFRFYRYDPGQRFHWHYDGYYERSPTEQSALTFMVYLNEGFGGGATEFDFRFVIGDRSGEWLVPVIPETGMALVFVHRILHQGAAVTKGRKYVLRSDVMYRWAGG